MKPHIYVAALLIALWLAGCIGGGGSSSLAPSSSGSFGEQHDYNLTILSEEEILYTPSFGHSSHEKPNLTFNTSLEDIANYTAQPTDPLRILFFNISTSEENGRLILISKGDFDVVVANVPESKVDEAAMYLKKYADDIECFIVPSSISSEGDAALLEQLHIAKLILPDYDDESLASLEETANERSIPVLRASKGTTACEPIISIRFATPYRGEFSDRNNNALSFYLKDRNFTAFISNDIVEGVFSRIVATADYTPVDVFTVPSYGVSSSQGGAAVSPITVFLDHVKPKAAIFEGQPLDFNRVEVVEDPRDFFVRYFSLRSIPTYAVGNHEMLAVRYDGHLFNVSTG